MTEGGRLVLLAFTAAAAFSDLCLGKIRNVQILLMLAAGAGWLAIHAPDKIPGVAAAMALTLAQLGGLGAGDIKLLMVLAPFLGVQWYIVNFVFSFLIGAVFSAVLLIRYRDFSRTVHFAVPVCISVMLCLLLQQLGIQSETLINCLT